MAPSIVAHARTFALNPSAGKSGPPIIVEDERQREMKQASEAAKAPYEPPRVRVLGSVHELTQGTNKDLGGADGITFQQQSVHWTS
jgi:hypothetical protein